MKVFQLFFCLVFAMLTAIGTKSANAEKAVVHAGVPWESASIVTRKNTTLRWSVSRNDLWSFNAEIFPKGHTANGVKGIPALLGYVLPGANMGMLIGKIGNSGRIFPMGLSGETRIASWEAGSYIYLTINDELSQIYGKGFKDNNGDIVVTLALEPRISYNIQFIYYEKCPGYKRALINLQKAMKEEKIDDDVVIIKLNSVQDAKNLRITGSPTIRINQKDVDPFLKKSKSFGLQCRMYIYDNDTFGWPGKEMIKIAFQEARKSLKAKSKKW